MFIIMRNSRRLCNNWIRS